MLETTSGLKHTSEKGSTAQKVCNFELARRWAVLQTACVQQWLKHRKTAAWSMMEMQVHASSTHIMNE